MGVRVCVRRPKIDASIFCLENKVGVQADLGCMAAFCSRSMLDRIRTHWLAVRLFRQRSFLIPNGFR